MKVSTKEVIMTAEEFAEVIDKLIADRSDLLVRYVSSAALKRLENAPPCYPGVTLKDTLMPNYVK
jgi:hypothetical protein